MSKANALAGLIGNYGESGDESDEYTSPVTPAKRSLVGPSELETFQNAASAQGFNTVASATIHPAPIPYCPWSACYDETSGFTYYWNQQTNAVTWEAPPEYLLALKLAQQHLHAAGSAEVSAEEWQLYQQALAEKQQAKVIAKPAAIKKPPKVTKEPDKHSRFNKKRCYSEDEDEKIELITSYHNSDSESDHEAESPKKKAAVAPPPPSQPTPPVKPKNPHKKAKTKPVAAYGPSLPPAQNYSVPIGPEMPPELLENKTKPPEVTVQNGVTEKETKKEEDYSDDEENTLLKRLKDKAKLLEKLGGELPSGLKKIIREETKSGTASPAVSEDKKSIDVDELLEELEKKELPKVVKAKKIDMFNEDSKSPIGSPRNSPRSGIQTPKSGTNTPVPALFPSSKNIDETAVNLFPGSVTNVKSEETDKEVKPEPTEAKLNVYLAGVTETTEQPRKKLRISNSVLPERKKAEPVSYTTKYSQHIEGFSNERVGLGFSKEEEETPKTGNAISYGKGLMFTKGETLNEEKKDEDLDDLTDLVEAKLKYLNQLQPGVVAPVQEMMIQMQTLVSAFRFGALAPPYWRRWAQTAAGALAALERAAAPPGWAAAFQRAEGRYRYTRETDGFAQWEYPAVASTDMDISTTPPHPSSEHKEEVMPPPPPPPPAASPPPAPPAPPAPRPATPPPPAWSAEPPPPPAWGADPPPPGCDDPPPLPTATTESKQEIGDELMSFYNDIAELEKGSTTPPLPPPAPAPAAPASPPPPPAPAPPRAGSEPRRAPERRSERDKEREREEKEKPKKKTKVKISTSMGKKHKTVSSMVAKWQQVADEIHSD